MIIEFIGTPGAGKTTLMNPAVACLAAQGYRAWTVVDAARPLAARTLLGRAIIRLAPARWHRPLLWQLFYAATRLERVRFLARHPRLMGRVWNFQRRRPLSAADRRHVRRWFNHQTGVYEFMRRRLEPADAVLFDEGFIHRVVQLFASEKEIPDPVEVRAYVDLLPRPDLLIYPTAPLDICRRRVTARGLWERFAVKPPEETARFLTAAECAVAIAVEAARRRQWTILELDNGGDDPAIAAGRLQRALADLTPAQFQPARSRPVLIEP